MPTTDPASRLPAVISATPAEAGTAAGRAAADVFARVLGEQERARVIFASAPSQEQMLTTLGADPRIDWTHVDSFGMHLSIAGLMGLPFFSGIMASADAVLVSSATWVAIVTWLRTVFTEGRLTRGIAQRMRVRQPGPAGSDRARSPRAAAAKAEDDTVHVNA